MRAVVVVAIALTACGGENPSRPVIGEPRWARELPFERIWDATMDADGDVIVAASSILHIPSVRALRRDTGDDRWTVSLLGEYTWVSGVAASPDGGVAVCGIFEGAVDFGGTVLETTPDDVATELFVASYDSLGGLRWVRSLGAETRGETWRIAVAADGTVVVGGWFRMFAGTASEDQDVFAAAFGAGGAPLWTYTATLAGPQLAGQVLVAPDGDVVLGDVGTETVRLAPGGEMRWMAEPPGSGVMAFEPSGELLVVGVDTNDALRLWRLDPTGEVVAELAPGAYDTGSIAVATDATIVLGGRVAAGAALVAIDPEGNLLDTRTFSALEGLGVVGVGLDGTIAFLSGSVITLLDAPQ